MEDVWKDINLRGTIFQDFLAGPIPKNPPNTVPAGYVSPASTALTLKADHQGLIQQPQHVSDMGYLAGMPFDALEPHPPAGMGSNGRKRWPESENNSVERRHKRMIKNRESAARSRARKQAYTNELEIEIAHLTEENARLKHQQEQLCIAAYIQLPKKQPLRRTSTAPF